MGENVVQDEFDEVDPTIHAWVLTNYDAVFKIGKNTFPFYYYLYDSGNEEVKQFPGPKAEPLEYKRWFRVFEDFSGAELLVYYPINAKEAQIIRVWLVNNWSNESWYEQWRHGERGLCEEVLVWSIMDFVDDIQFTTS